ncbi:hypothetical protein DFH08DRAFT_966299 [Mycena albidolilacea]|uniref:Uncharacterized protein n=1 Tax=Mycena albidolilacea TaxID=1033008 RepID=A0AAD7ELV5_9AGAR|nr:hypothetical protein DFH08DRAFT_966299 [Mycena albidolilacea]
MCLRISASSPTSSSAQTTRANPAVNGATGSSASGFFAPRVSQQPRVVSNPVPSTAPVDRPSTVAQLNKDLAELAHNHPLDTSERIFDESLGDEDGEGDDSENAELAQKETEEAEPKSLSENHQWLKTTLAQIVKDTNGRLKMPRCYKDGQFWVRPRDPVFALKRAAVYGFSPASLYLLPIFVWLPHFLPGRPDSFKCECGASIILNGYNENPIARRVSTLTGPDYFLLTNRYLCPLRRGNDKGCGKSYQGSDPWIIRQLPEFVQRAFPACLSTRGALDTGEMDVMKATFAGHFGADPFSKMVRELKVLHHDRLETMYYCAALHFGLRGPQQVPQFSKFDDSLGYAGYAPSRQYFKSMFTAWFSVHRTLIDRVMSSLSATIIKADHTYKTVDHQSCLPGGEPINVAMYSIVNSDEEVRAYAFTLTQSFPPLCEVYERMQLELQRHGHRLTQLIYTDNPRAERKFHESVNASLCENVQHLVLDAFSDLPPVKPSNIPIDYFSLQAGIDTACDEILVALESLGPGEPLILSLSVKFTAEALHIIQLCSSKKAYVFRVGQIKSQAQVPPCLLSLLTNRRVVKIGNQIRQSMRSISTAWSMPSLACIDSSSVVDLSHIAKVKGVVSDATSLLPTLASTVLKHSIPDFQYLSTHDWSGEVKEDDIKKLAQEVDCVAQIYQKLTKIDSVGLPLQQSQICAGQLVTLVIGKEVLAEGELVAHNGSWPSPSDDARMKVSEASTVIKLTKLLLPGHIIARHAQTLQWLMEHGGHAVVQIRTLRTRSLTPPHPSNHDPSLGVPAPVNLPSESSQHHPSRPSPLPRPTVKPDPAEYSREDEPDTGPDEQELDSDSLNNDNLADSTEQMVMEALRHAQEILQQPNTYNTLASRVLDDAYHFMDRLLRLLSKKHSVFNEFAHQFSETIFVRDQDDEAKVREVLEKKGISWDYAIRSKKAALNRRIRRYIPPSEKLAADLETLFNSFKDEARKTAETLLETVRLGFVSDPPGIPLYYVRGKDRDGLILYRMVRGTNSVEGGVHMLIRRIFGSLCASPELTEATIGNWFLRRNRTIGHYNRTGKKWRSHFDIWLLDDLVERALTLGIEPSVPVPRLLATRIATSESFGIIPIGSAIAQEAAIPQLPPLNLQAAPHHNDVRLHALTHLCTKSCNIYRYIQLRQRTPVPVIPVHTVAEYQFFKQNVDAFRTASTRDTAPELAYKTTDYIAFAVFWNHQVMRQSPQIIEADRRLYFKLPEQLLRHHKKTLQWKSSRATLYMGSNTQCLAPIQDLLGDANRLAVVLPAIPLEPEQVDFDADAAVGVDLESFNPMAIRRCVAEELRSDAHFDPVPSSEDNIPASESVPSTSPSSVNLPSPSANPSPTAQDRKRQSANLAGAADARMRTVHFSTLAKGKVPVTAVYACRMIMTKQLENVFGSHSSL